jgi:N-hydroxyarylamine O-acetyltransferase
MAPPERPEGARSHMLLRIDLDEGSFLADTGFGAHLLDAPLRLDAGTQQQTAFATLQLSEADGRYTLQTLLPAGWQDVYRFSLEPQLPADYAVANWFTATHPDSLFRNNLLMERLLPDRRVTLFNAKLVERPLQGDARDIILASAAELGDVMGDVFGIDSPAGADEVWARIAGGARR